MDTSLLSLQVSFFPPSCFLPLSHLPPYNMTKHENALITRFCEHPLPPVCPIELNLSRAKPFVTGMKGPFGYTSHLSIAAFLYGATRSVQDNDYLTRQRLLFSHDDTF